MNKINLFILLIFVSAIQTTAANNACPGISPSIVSSTENAANEISPANCCEINSLGKSKIICPFILQEIFAGGGGCGGSSACGGNLITTPEAGWPTELNSFVIINGTPIKPDMSIDQVDDMLSDSLRTLNQILYNESILRELGERELSPTDRPARH